MFKKIEDKQMKKKCFDHRRDNIENGNFMIIYRQFIVCQ